jgi:urea transport system permease protein
MADPINPVEWALVRRLRSGGLRTPMEWADHASLALLFAGLLLVFPWLAATGLVDQAMVSQLGRYCCLAIMAVGLDLVWGYTGILSLCQAMFFTIGGYAMGMHLCLHGPLDGEGIPRALFVVSSEIGGMTLPWFWQPFSSLWFALLMVVAVPGIVAFIFGYAAFRSRIKGVYFSIITQALTVGMFLVFCRNDLQLCGTNGLTNFTTLFGLPLADGSMRLLLYELSALALAAAVLGARWLTTTRHGRLLVAVRDSETRLRFAGYQPVWFKTAVFTLGAMLAGIGGALYAPQTGIITPANMQAAESLLVVVWVAVGGRGTITGAVVGALLINLLYAWLTTLMPKVWPFILGAIFVAVVLFLPDGLVGAWRKLMARMRGTETA